MDAYSINGFTEGERMAYRPVRCCIGPTPENSIFDNHFAYQRVPIEEAGIRIDPRETRHETIVPGLLVL